MRDNSDLELAAGDRIRHDDFGEGRVDTVTGEGAKKLLIKVAPTGYPASSNRFAHRLSTSR